jgi:hypothetical protein
MVSDSAFDRLIDLLERHGGMYIQPFNYENDHRENKPL